MDLATCTLQHAALNLRHANVHCSLYHEKWALQHNLAMQLPPKTLTLPHAPCNKHTSTLQHAPCNNHLSRKRVLIDHGSVNISSANIYALHFRLSSALCFVF
jgi:hypothetical protein